VLTYLASRSQISTGDEARQHIRYGSHSLCLFPIFLREPQLLACMPNTRKNWGKDSVLHPRPFFSPPPRHEQETSSTRTYRTYLYPPGRIHATLLNPHQGLHACFKPTPIPSCLSFPASPYHADGSIPKSQYSRCFTKPFPSSPCPAQQREEEQEHRRQAQHLDQDP